MSQPAGLPPSGRQTPEPRSARRRESLSPGEAAEPQDRRSAELALYLHIPFCVRKCHYCDFNSGPVSRPARRAYLEALTAEIVSSPWAGALVGTLFFGGGTPSELNPAELQKLVEALRATFRFAEPGEWTLECNPGTVTPESFLAFRALGFNRISLGAQTFDDRHLEALGRMHRAGDIGSAFAWARDAGFENINLDLIFALPQQTPAEWESDLNRALQLAPEHLSLYHLTIEPGTEFGHRLAQGRLRELDEEVGAAMYERALDLTLSAGYRQYEISNFARPGFRCRHNLIYWRNEPYLGFGVSAASFMGGLRWTNTGNLKAYARSAPGGRPVRALEERLPWRRALGEEIMLRLRTEEGFSLGDLSRRYRRPLGTMLSGEIDFLLREDLLQRSGDRIRLTRRGKLLANAVCLQFL